ncbi:NHL domain-containing protein [Streptomyces sp. DW26H14]|uniref:NHL domain-containing protein n=1 Tax=Streptomyces sp. DW26H14 TaxID=3435395 RepID=UPI00403E2C40
MMKTRRHRWNSRVVSGAVALGLAMAGVSSGGAFAADPAPSVTAPQGYDLTGASYCSSGTGLATAGLDTNLISNAGAEYTTARGEMPGGAGTAAGSTVPDPDSVLLPDCWAVTSSIAGSDPANEIASAVTASYPGKTGSRNFYGGASANDKAVAGTVTTASQTIDLGKLGDIAGKHVALSASLGGYGNQNDATTLSAAWEDADGNAVGDGQDAVTTVGPVLAVDRGDFSSMIPRRGYGTVPVGAAKVVVTLTFTMGGAGNNDANADNLSLVIGDSAVAPAGQTVDEAGNCPHPAALGAGKNLVSNPGAEDYTSVAYPYGSGGGVTDAGQASATVTVPDCWTGHDDLPSPDAVMESKAQSGPYPGLEGSRLFFGGTDSSSTPAANPGFDPAPGFTNQVQGTTTTATQSIDVGSMNAGGQGFELSGELGGYSTQGDFAQVDAAFEDASGTTVGSARIGPITEAQRVAAADYLAAKGGSPAGSGMLPAQTLGTLPAGTARVVITVSATAIATGSDSNGMADDLGFVIDPGSPPGDAQSYDLTTGTHGTSPNCPDPVAPSLDHNLVSNPGAEEYTSDLWFGAPGDAAVDVPDCWVSASSLPAPRAVAESYAQSPTSYPPVRTSSRVFWGGHDPQNAIAGVATTETQPIDLSPLGDVAGKSFKLSGLLGGYATQNDNAVVNATFQDADGKTLNSASIGPVVANQRGGVSELAPQAWYGTVPAGAAKAVLKITLTAVNTGADNNAEADDLSLVIGDSTKPTGPILQTVPYDASAGGDISIDPTTGLPLPPAGGLYRPAGVSASKGVVYASNTGDNVLAALADGQSTVIAGSLEAAGDNGDGGPATAATLYQPAGTAVDAAGDIFIADSADNVVREIDGRGVIRRVAGTGSAGSGLTGQAERKATRTALNHPEAVAVDAKGNLYIADTYNNRVEKVTPKGVISAFAGSGKAGYAGDGGAARKAKLTFPSGVAVDQHGDVYIADASNSVIRKVDARTGVIRTVAGDYAKDQAENDGRGGYSGDGGRATQAQLNGAQGVAVDSAGDLFVADTLNNAIREVTPDGTITTVVNAEAPAAGGETSGQAPSASLLNTPGAVAVDPSTGVLYVADTANSSIAEVLGVTG